MKIIKNDKKRIMVALLASTFLMTACSTTAGTEVPETQVTTEATTTTAEATTEATTTTSEETTMPDLLKMSIDEVADNLLEAMGSDYVVFAEYNPSSEWYIDPQIYSDKNRSVGILNCKSIGFSFSMPYTLNQDGDLVMEGDYSEITGTEDYNSMIVSITIYEFDTTSEEYKKLSVGSEFEHYYGTHDGDVYQGSAAVTAINGQYVISVYAALGKGGGFNPGDPRESEPPFTIGKAQEAYEAFQALE